MGQFHNMKEGKLATVIAEAWCNRDFYIWHWFTGCAGTNNYKTVMRAQPAVDLASPLFTDRLIGSFDTHLDEKYKVNEGGTRGTWHIFYWTAFIKTGPFSSSPYIIRQMKGRLSTRSGRRLSENIPRGALAFAKQGFNPCAFRRDCSTYRT